MNKKALALLATGLLVVFAVIVWTSYGTGQRSDDMAAGTVPGKRALDFTLPDLDGNQVSLSRFRGTPVFLNFWASWCPPCRWEMPFLQEIHEEMGEEVVILAVNLGESPEVVRRFVEENGFTFRVLLDERAEVMEMYNLRTIPTSLFIDRDGIICSGQNAAMNKEMMLKGVKKAQEACLAGD